ncbi:MAG: MarR family winged helix-turn-helix transcriptional regulator [Burkholderiales bacterium]
MPQRTKPSRVQASKTDARPLPTRLYAQVEITATRHKTLDRSTLHLLLAMYRCFATLDRNQSEEVRKIGLTGTQFNILTTLERVGRPVSMGDMAAMMVLQPTNLSGIVNLLAKRGLLRREVSATDQRSFLVTLTPAGQRMLDDFLPDHWRHLEALMRGLTEAERTMLVTLLRKFMVSIDDAEAAPPAMAQRASATVTQAGSRPRAHNGVRT